MIKSIINKNIETKKSVSVYDTVTFSGNTATGFKDYDLSDIPQGSGKTERIGNKVTCDSVNILFSATGSTAGTTYFRISVLVKTNPSSIGIDETSPLYEDTTGLPVAWTSFTVGGLFWNYRVITYPYYKPTVRTVFDKTIRLGTSSTNGADCRIANITCKLRDTITYQPEADTPSVIRPNKDVIVLVTGYIGSEPTMGTATATYQIQAVLNYKDL